jgi:hypothetical protein
LAAEYTDLIGAPNGGARASRFKRLFKETYAGTMYSKDAANLGYDYHTIIPLLHSKQHVQFFIIINF